MADDQTDQALAEEAKTDAAEVQADIAEAKADVALARKEGDEDRATRLQARIDALNTDLTEIKATLKTLAERPFAPAPQPKAKSEKEVDKPEAEERPKEKVHRFGSRRWFGDRAYED